MDNTPPAPVLLDEFLEDDDLVRRLAEAGAPYLPTQRYFANTAEYEAVSGADEVEEMPIASLFRGVWADPEPTIGGVEPILEHPQLHEAAREVFSGKIVRPRHIYANLTYQLPFAQGGGHTDIPAFRGFDRREHPIAFLSIMGHSGLFEDVRLRIATAVSWFYRGQDGGFEYWPQGPDAPSRRHEGDIHNTAVVADNDVMWHRALGTGAMDDGMVSGMTLDSRLEFDGDGWAIRDGERTLAVLDFEQLRISVSWKALVFGDEDEAAAYDAGEGGIGLDEVLARFKEDLAARGIDVVIPSEDPLRDPGFVRVLHRTYVREPAAALA